MPIRYFDRNGRSISHVVWRALQRNPDYVTVASDDAPVAPETILVTTVWLGLSTVAHRRRPLLYQTLVADSSGVPIIWRWHDLPAAQRGHALVLAAVLAGGPPPPDDTGLPPPLPALPHPPRS